MSLLEAVTARRSVGRLLPDPVPRELVRKVCEESQHAYAGLNKPVIEVQAEPLLISGSKAVALAVLAVGTSRGGGSER